MGYALSSIFFKNFNPRSPYGERPPRRISSGLHTQFQSTLPLRGATMAVFEDLDSWLISIHAPLTGSDKRLPLKSTLIPISIHAPLTGSDGRVRAKMDAYRRFQSTLPLRGATDGIRDSQQMGS